MTDDDLPFGAAEITYFEKYFVYSEIWDTSLKFR